MASGELTLERGVAESCAGRCDDLIVQLQAVKDRAADLTTIDGFGDRLPSGVALAAKFGRKASGGDYSLDQALAEHIAEVEQMRDLFTKIGAQYQAAEDANQQSLTNVDAGF
ncbi:hypothetical protein [Rhodococcus sp. BE178]|uniref:hypothetical protein n=1 Tax=Rhodococcus sp. BE178 TaxID=2817737 RepID=UPI003D1D4D6E